MLLIEKVVKLMDDFHFGIFREHVKNLSIRSYYPLALIDVIDRSFEKEQDSERLYKDVYGDPPDGEKDMKKFFQLAHYTFRLTGYLARNYPDYLQHNNTRVQYFVNTGQLEKANKLADILLEVAEKIEDFDTAKKVLRFMSQREIFMNSHKQALAYIDKTREYLQYKNDLNEINYYVYKQLKDKGKEDNVNLPEMMAFFEKYKESPSIAVQLMANLNACYLLYIHRSPDFFEEENFNKLEAIEETLQKNEYIVFPHLYNLHTRVSFLKLNFSVRKYGTEKVLEEAAKLIEQSEEDLFWNSFINLPEINSIAIQTSYFVTNYFTSYREDHFDILPTEAAARIKFLKNRCKILLANQLLQDKFTVNYINLMAMYSGLLMLGAKEEIEESYTQLENLLLFYQQVPFHSYIDPIYTTMIMAGFCLKDFGKIERSYRRYKKSTTGKVVNSENDLTVNGFYYISKWLETKKSQYVKKLSAVIEQTADKPNLDSTRQLLTEAMNYYEISLLFGVVKKN